MLLKFVLKHFSSEGYSASENLLKFFQKFIKVKAKNLFCTDVDPKIIPKTVCKLKATRDGSGLYTIMAYNATELKELWIHWKLMTKLVGNSWHPTGLEGKHDLCLLLVEKNYAVDILPKIILAFCKKLLPKGLIHACPYKGTFGIENFNIADLIEKAVPQAVPKGIYRGFARLYNGKTNQTYIIVTSVSEFAPVDITDSWVFGK